MGDGLIEEVNSHWVHAWWLAMEHGGQTAPCSHACDAACEADSILGRGVKGQTNRQLGAAEVLLTGHLAAAPPYSPY